MEDLISRKLALEAIEEGISDAPLYIQATAMQCITEAPAVDAEPIRHGRWICASNGKVALVCSVCGQVMPFVPEYLPGTPPYCNCGAKMDGDDANARPPDDNG